jgi:hypothetical protein
MTYAENRTPHPFVPIFTASFTLHSPLESDGNLPIRRSGQALVFLSAMF